MRWFLAFLLMTAPAWAQSPCDGRITDNLPHPLVPTAVPKPAQGECYVDPVFGTKICRVGNADPAQGPEAIVKTNYNSTWGWNADESLIYLWQRGGRIYKIFEGDEPYSYVMTIAFSGSATTGSPTDIEHVIWDAHDPNVMWYPNSYRYSTQTVPKLYKVTLDRDAGTFSEEVYRDFSTPPTNCPIANALSLGHSHDMSIDGKGMLAMSCGNSTNRLIILYSTVEDRVYGVRPSPFPEYGWAPISFLSGTGAFFSGTAEVMDVNLNTTRTLNLAQKLEHQVMGLRDGAPVLNRVNFDEVQNGSLSSYDMETGALSVIIGPPTGWPYPPSGTHPSLSPRDGSSWVAVGSFGSEPLGQGVLQNEIYLGNTATGEVCRVAHARTAARTGPWGYWGETHPQISNDGYRVLFTSDWLGSSTVDAYVVDLRPQDTAILTSSIPNAVVGESFSRPLSIAGGQPPYVCTKTLGAFPTGITIAGCEVQGTSTQVETQTYTLQACDSLSQCDSKEFVHTTQERPEIITRSLPDAAVGSPYAQTFTAQKGVLPYVWTTAGNACSTAFVGGVLTGTPLCLETCSFSVTVTDSHAQPISATAPFEFDVVVPSGVCPCAPTDLAVEVSE